MNRKNKKEKRRSIRKSAAALLTVIVLFSIVYSPVAFAVNLSEDTNEMYSTQETTQQTNNPEMLAENSTHAYTAENYFDASGTSTNEHFDVKGIFVDDSNNASLILFLKKNSNVKEILYIVVNGKQINAPDVEQWEDSITINLPDGSSKTLQSTFGILVIEAGLITNLQEHFLIDVKTVAGGWDIDGLEVIVDIDYSVRKTVSSQTANIGDKLTYTITVNNNSEIALQGVDITDSVPGGLKVISVNGSDNLNWQTADKVLYLDKDIALGVGVTKTYTIAAEVTSDAAPGLLTNTATIGGSVIPKTDTADVMIHVNHTVTVKKIVTGNLGDQRKEFQFTATVKDADGNVITVPTSDNSAYTVDNNGSIFFRLKNGDSVSITGVPDGAAFTVIETDENWNGYETSYEYSTDNSSWMNGSSEVIYKDITFKVTNDKNGTINTGVFLDSFSYILILAGVIAAITVLIIHKHHQSI